MPVRVVTDSTSDIPRHIARELDIVVVPLSVAFGEEVFRDGVDIDAPAFYERLVAAKELPHTSQPSVEAFRQTYEELAGETDQVVSIHVSSRLSGTINAASIAREELLERLHIDLIDSFNVSLGLGAVVIEAAEAAGFALSPQMMTALGIKRDYDKLNDTTDAAAERALAL